MHNFNLISWQLPHSTISSSTLLSSRDISRKLTFPRKLFSFLPAKQSHSIKRESLSEFKRDIPSINIKATALSNLLV